MDTIHIPSSSHVRHQVLHGPADAEVRAAADQRQEPGERVLSAAIDPDPYTLTSLYLSHCHQIHTH
jgi:hypothetical protein